MPWLYQQLGEEGLVKGWPKIRESLDDPSDAIAMQKRQAWDALWASHTLGDAQYPVNPKVTRLVHRRKTLQRLRQIISQPGITISGLAKCEAPDDSKKRLSLYSRIYKCVRELEVEDLVEVRKETYADGKIQCRLLPRESVNARMWELHSSRIIMCDSD